MEDPADGRRDGIEGACTPAPPRHVLLLHSGRESCTEAVLAFLRRSGPGPTLAVLSPAMYDLIGGALGPDATYEDATVLGRNPARVIPAIRRFAESNARDRPVRVVTEQWWDQRELAERAELARHEALANLAFAGLSVELVCLYDTRHVREGIVEDARHSHPFVADATGVRRNPDFVDPEVLLRMSDAPLEPPPSSAEALPVKPGGLSPLRAAVEERGHTAGLPSERVEDLVLAVNELATNVVSHGNGQGVLRVWQESRWLVCEVAGRGKVDDPFVGTRRPRGDDTSGRGLWIVNQLCDLVELRSSSTGTAVRLRFARPKSATVTWPAPAC